MVAAIATSTEEDNVTSEQAIMNCHVILVDFRNKGEMFRLTIEGNKDEILEYFYALSEDVRYVKNCKRHKKDKGTNVLPCGIVRNCKWECNKLDVMTKYNSRYVDARREVK